MAKLGINTGSNADDGTGDSLRVGAGKINSNFNEVYSLLTGAGNNGTTLLSGIVTSITAGSNITLWWSNWCHSDYCCCINRNRIFY